jgi:hypothetical protein
MNDNDNNQTQASQQQDNNNNNSGNAIQNQNIQQDQFGLFDIVDTSSSSLIKKGHEVSMSNKADKGR